MSDFPIQLTIKGGEGFAVPWITIGANNPTEFVDHVKGLADTGAYQVAVDAASAFVATYNAAPVTQPVPGEYDTQAPLPGGWDTHPAPHSTPSPTQAAVLQTGSFGAVLDPSGRVCEECGKRLEQKKTTNGNLVWRCPEWRWNNGNPNNHTALKPGS